MSAVGTRNMRKATVKIQKKCNTYFLFLKNTSKYIAKIRNPNPKIRNPLKFQEFEIRIF